MTNVKALAEDKFSDQLHWNVSRYDVSKLELSNPDVCNNLLIGWFWTSWCQH